MAFLTDSQLDLLGQFLPKSTPNLSSAIAQANFVSAHLGDCTSRGETAGPFSSPSPSELCLPPLLARCQRKPDKLRLIHHLSAPEGLSVNDGITTEDFSLQYVKVDDAIARIMQLGRGTLLAKFDIRRAFRLCPVRPEGLAPSWYVLGGEVLLRQGASLRLALGPLYLQRGG